MIRVEIDTVTVEIPWPNGRGKDLLALFKATHPGLAGGPFAYGETQEAAIVNLLNGQGGIE